MNKPAPAQPWFVAVIAVTVPFALVGCGEAKSKVVAPTTVTASALALTHAQSKALSRTSAQVLLPQRPAWLANAFVTADDRWYTASIDGDGYTIVIEGNAEPIEHPEIRAAYPADAPTRKSPRIGRNELIVEAAFVEAGVSYSIEVECVSPDTNPRCVQDAFVLQVVADLVTVPRSYSGNSAVPTATTAPPGDALK